MEHNNYSYRIYVVSTFTKTFRGGIVNEYNSNKKYK